MSLIEAISIEQPANGWFVPNCQDETLFFSAQAIEVRKDLTLPLFVSGEQLNLLQVRYSSTMYDFHNSTDALKF